MKNPSDIKCPFCGCEMIIETLEYTKPCRAFACCGRCAAHGPSAYHEQVGRAEELAIKAMTDYNNKIDADLWRASKVVQ